MGLRTDRPSPLGRAVVLGLCLLVLSAAAPGASAAGAGPQGGQSHSRGPVPDTDSEPNDALVDATVTAPNVTIGGTVSVVDSRDAYAVPVFANDSAGSTVVSATVRLITPSAGLRLSILDGEGFRLSEGTTEQDPLTLEAAAVANGTFFVTVVFSKGAASVTYDLDLNTSTVAHLSDSDSSPITATPLADNSTRGDTVDSFNDTSDFYGSAITFTGNVSDVLLLQLTEPPGADLQIELFGANDQFLANSSDSVGGGVERYLYLPPFPGPVFIRVWAAAGSGAYALTLRHWVGHTDDNNLVADAQPISTADTVVGEFTAGLDDLDYYQLPLVAQQDLRVDLQVLSHNATWSDPTVDLWVLGPGGAFLANGSTSGDVLSVVATAAVSGNHTIRVGSGDPFSFGAYSFSMTTVAPPRLRDPLPVVTIAEDGEVVLDLATVFVDERPLTYAVVANDTIGVTVVGGNATLHPLLADWTGTAAVTLRADSDVDKSAVATLTVQVLPENDGPTVAPQFAPGSVAYNITEDLPFTLPFPALTAFTDVEDDPLDLSVVSSAHLAAALASDGTLTITPALNWTGDEGVNLTASDPSSAQATLVIALQVQPAPDAPAPVLARVPQQLELLEDVPLPVPLAAWFVDGDDETLHYEARTDSGNVQTLLEGDQLTLTGGLDFHGTDQLVVIATDPTNRSASVLVPLLVGDQNDPPRLNEAYHQTVAALTLQEDAAPRPLIDLLALFDDPDGDTLTFERTVTAPLEATIEGTYVSIALPKDWSGNGTLVLTAADPSGQTAVATVAMSVLAVNDPPVLSKASVTPTRGTTATTFSFSVTYADPEGSVALVEVLVDEKAYSLNRISGEVREGAVFRLSTTLPAGTHTITFRADDGAGVGNSKQVLILPGPALEVASTASVWDSPTTQVLLIIALPIVIGVPLALAVRGRTLQRELLEELEEERGRAWDGEE